MRIVKRIQVDSDFTTLLALSRLSGLDNTERRLASQMLAQSQLSPRDRECIRAMRDRHLGREVKR